MRNHQTFKWLIVSFLILIPLLVYAQNSFLSNLSATKDSPIYTTYAAATKRSEFTLDQGFHFMFYNPERGVDFLTDRAGDWCIGFKREAKYVYQLKDMYHEPVIYTSYSDIVKYFYFPYKDVKVNVTFLVYSSRIAVQDITVTNTGRERVDLKIIPFLQNNYRTFNDVEFHPDKNCITFTHEELPDGWVIGHNVPYVARVYDLFLLSQSPDRMTSFRSYRWGEVEIPHRVELDKRQVYLVWGKIKHCYRQSKIRMMVLLNNNRKRLLTESAPIWGSTENNIDRYGFYRIELGNFGKIKTGDHYKIILMSDRTNQYAVVEDTVKNLSSFDSQRHDATFHQLDLLPPPQNLRKDVWGSGTEIRLYWDKIGDNIRYNVYRRDYRKKGFYELIAENIDHTFYTDKNITGDKIYGYVVTAVDPHGRMSVVSKEVNNIAGSDFLTDVKYPDQIKTYVKDFARVIATEKRIVLQPGAVKHLRIIRGFAKNRTNLETIFQQAKGLINEDLGKYIKADEEIYSHVPGLTSNNPEKQMLYWSAFTLMHQVMLPPEGKCSYNYYVFSREPTWGWGHGGQVFHESLSMLAYAYMDPVGAMNSQRVYLERQHKKVILITEQVPILMRS